MDFVIVYNIHSIYNPLLAYLKIARYLFIDFIDRDPDSDDGSSELSLDELQSEDRFVFSLSI